MSDEGLAILVVDDDQNSRDTVKDFLKSAGFYNVLEAENGKDALALMRKSPIELVITDWEMPIMSGLELLKTVRGDPALAKMSFVIITSPVSNEKMKVTDAASLGVTGYIIKPFRRRVLLQKISDVLFEQRWAARRGVLVADDMEEARQFVVEALSQMGFGPIYDAADGEKGLELLMKHEAEIALVISDWQMPKLTGIEFLRKIRTTRGISDMPFIMATSQTSREQMKVKLAIESEVDHYLMKPFRLKDLKEKVDLVLARAKIEAQKKRMIEYAKLAVQDNELGEAEKLYQAVLAHNADIVEAWLGLADLELQRAPVKGIEAAIHYIERAIKIDPARDVPHLKLAEVYEAIMDLEKAIAHLKKAIQTCRSSPELHYNLARMLIRRGRIAEAKGQLEKTLELDPQHVKASELYISFPSDGGGGAKV